MSNEEVNNAIRRAVHIVKETVSSTKSEGFSQELREAINKATGRVTQVEDVPQQQAPRPPQTYAGNGHTSTRVRAYKTDMNTYLRRKAGR